jgi:excisionase family DNA binding protein
MLTVIEIAKELNISEHAVRRYVKKADIQPIRWVGFTRLFDRSALNKILAVRKSTGRPRKDKG